MNDLSDFAVLEAASIQLKDASGNLMFKQVEGGDPLPMQVKVYGPGSRQHAQANAKKATRSFQRLRKKGNIEISADEQGEENAEFLAAITAGFENVEYKGLTGNDLALAIYKDRKLGFIADQVAEFAGDWENFTEGSAKS